jgi:hypothetical protein
MSVIISYHIFVYGIGIRRSAWIIVNNLSIPSVWENHHDAIIVNNSSMQRTKIEYTTQTGLYFDVGNKDYMDCT